MAKKRKGLPKKYAKLGFKAGWKKYKKSKMKKNPAKKRRITAMAKKRKKPSRAVRVYVKNPRRKTYRRRYRRNPNIAKTLQGALVPMVAGAFGVIGLNMLLSRATFIPAQYRGFAKLGVALLMVMQKNQFLKWAGIVVGGIAIKDVVTNYIPALAGDEMTDTEIEELDDYIDDLEEENEMLGSNSELLGDNSDLMGDSSDEIQEVGYNSGNEMLGSDNPGFYQRELTMDMID